MSEPMHDVNQQQAVDALIADGRPFVRCACGFVAVSDSKTENRWALEEHPCPHRADVEEDGEDRWYHHVFSLWGLLILVVVASAVLVALGKAKW